MLITADQIRAARALKNWSQTDLAERTGLAVPTIANIELGKQIPGKNTIEKIIDSFSLGGIRFTPNGVEFDKDEITTIFGDGKFKFIQIDAIRVLENLPPKERFYLAFNAEDHATTEEEQDLYDLMTSKGIILRRIVSQKARIQHDYFKTKIIDPQYTSEKGEVFFFGDKVVFYTYPEGNQDVTTLIINNSRIADTYKKIFSYMWDSLKEAETKPIKKKGRK